MADRMQMPQQIQIKPWEHPYHKCEQCGSVNYDMGLLIKDVYGVEIGKVIPMIMEVVRCAECKTPTFLMTPQGPVDFKEIVKKEVDYANSVEQSKS